MTTIELQKPDSEKNESRVDSKSSSPTLKALVVDGLIPALQKQSPSQKDILSLYQSILAEVQRAQHVLIHPDSSPQMMGMLNQFRLNLNRALLIPQGPGHPTTQAQEKAFISSAFDNFKGAGKVDCESTKVTTHKKPSRKLY